ncbi:uncharacterized protein A1O9_07655 [Exophiala aquamarina CBS 119918]|uniref:AB hydrolase-1 domain-containing protein n=1 Tax=Exophiala aquamarina CBS 119918 TaxID=1182545 RepID=A0A072P7G6_9EURO|nr:uncharacterized protein A1O9_07655 [Exophiala aquamarina CBS 119918]KEF56074.1 hypothetical protein A1O9_07655 [Exophiala aquamarina CBS 119918]
MEVNGAAPIDHLYTYTLPPLSLDPAIPSPTLDFSRPSHMRYHSRDNSESVQVISSLIDSLSALSAEARRELRDDFELDQYTTNSHPARNQTPPVSTEPPGADDLDRDLHDPPLIDDSSDGDVAAAPVIRYARRPPVLSKRSSRSRFYSLNTSQPGLATRESQQSLRSRAESESVGVPSIERRHGSSASSTFSLISGFSVPRRHPTSESIREMATRPVAPKQISSDRRRRTESLYSVDQDKEIRHSARSSSIDGHSATGMQASDNYAPESPSTGALSRLSRGDLGNHMIPSRRSSLRRSVSGLPENSLENYRYSLPTNKLKELNIDTDLLESEDSTVRRIRELQEAREKRQKEWRNEARKSERAAKRHTIATAKVSRRSSPYPNSRLSVTEVVVETPEGESPLEMSACVTAADLAMMPVIVNDPQTPLSAVAPSHTFPNSAVPSRTNSIYGSNKSPAAHLKRNSTTNSIKQDSSLFELKTISDEVDAFLGAPRLTQRIRHPRTGRTIAFSEVGDPNGFVVLCCVGMGLTRYLTAFYDELARTLRLRLITPDRPGVGESSSVPEASCTPLNWVDDVAVICSQLEITRFSLLAHSAGAIYALATALKMPQYVRGRIHLLAPWIPPSQMPKGAALGPDSQPIANLPLSHKILSVLPAQILRVANSRFLTATSASVDAKPLKKKNKNLETFDTSMDYSFQDLNEDSLFENTMADIDKENIPTGSAGRSRGMSCYQANTEALKQQSNGIKLPGTDSRRQTQYSVKSAMPASRPVSPRLTVEARHALYNKTLTHRIWALATQNANPATDLVVCLERRKTIGFRYPEVTRSVVIHHGAKDTRVPLDNVRWLHSVMKRCELRVLDNEGHGLMASASAMSAVLGEIAKEWEEWEKIALGKEKRKKEDVGSTHSRGR